MAGKLPLGFNRFRRSGSDAAAAKPLEPTEPPSRPWYRRISIALSAFIMSVTIALINAFFVLRGPEVVLLPPEATLIYRDGDSDGAVLAFVFRMEMINAADSGHGDVLVRSQLRHNRASPSFAHESLVSVVPGATPSLCAGDRNRCIGFDGMTVVAREEELLDVPGGSARIYYLSYPLTPTGCSGNRACADYGEYPRAIQRLGAGRMTVRIDIDFFGDGHRVVECEIDLGPAPLAQLQQGGYTSVPCLRSSVRGDPWL